MKIKVRVHANSSQEKIVKISESDFEVWVNQKPIDGKANDYLTKYLGKYFGKKAKLIFGEKSKIKKFELFD